MRSYSCVLFVVASLAFSVGSVLVGAQSGNAMDDWSSEWPALALSYTPHDIISIDGDVDFDAQAAAEGWPGEGTESNPYMITGYEIDGADYRNAITISNTRVHFTVSECWLHNGGNQGIALTNVMNGSIVSNLCTDNVEAGLMADQSGDVNISDNFCYGNQWGIYASHSPWIEVHNNTCTLSSFVGIDITYSSFSTLRGNNCSGNYFGMSAFMCTSSMVESNNCSENEMGGMGMTACQGSTVAFNTAILNGGSGIHGTVYAILDNMFSFNVGHGTSAVAQILYNNTCHHNGLSGIAGSGFKEVRGNDCSHNSKGITMDDSGFAEPRIDRNFTGNDCSGNTDCGIEISGAPWGGEQRYLMIADNNCSGTGGSGISLSFVRESVVANNSCSGNAEYGVILKATAATRMSWNTFSGNGRHGLNFTYFELSNLNRYYSGGISVDNCTFAENAHGSAYLDRGFGFSFDNCSFAECSKVSVFSSDSGIMTLRRNTMVGCGLLIRSATLGGWNSHTIEDTNTVNGKPMMYRVGANGDPVPEGRGQIILVECRNMVVSSQFLNDLSVGLAMAYSTYNVVTSNSVCCNLFGIYLNHSDMNEFTRNAIYNNTGYGMHIDNGFQNAVFNNSFYLNNGAGFTYDPMHVQARDDGVMNVWDDSGRGNYWSDWTSPDSEPDGIVDDPYALDGTAGTMDNYPLVDLPVPIPEFVAPGPLLVLVIIICLAFAAGRNARGKRLG